MEKKGRRTFHISGRVIDSTTRGIEGLRVETWGKSGKYNDCISKAITDKKGAFKMGIEEARMREISEDEPQDLFSKVFRGEELVESTEDKKLWYVLQHAGFESTRGIIIETKKTINPKSNTTKKMVKKLKRPPRKVTVFHISGHITHRDTGKGLAGLRVDAVDKDLSYEQQLGSTHTDDYGQYEIIFTSDKIGKAEKGGPDIVVRVFDQNGTELGASEMLRNAPANVTIDLALALKTDPHLSEYEKLLAELTPLLKNVQIADLTDKDVESLAKETGIERQRIETLVQSARLTLETDLANVIFYGLLRQDLGPTLDEILAEPEDRIREALADAQEAGFIAALDALTIEATMLQLQRLRNQRTPLAEIARSMGVEPTSSIFGRLAGKNINTLADVRNTGGLRFVKDIDVSPEDPIVQKLDAHARLITLNPDISVNETLIANGYPSIAAIANATTEEIATALGDEPGSDRAAVLHANAKAQSAFLQNVATGFVANAATGIQITEDENIDHPIHKVLPETCGCKDCEAAVSPRAYLADLMQYAIDHLRDNGAKIDLNFFKANFHQPFSELPTNCAAQDKQVRQVRICIEVLRSYLGQRPLTPVARETPLKQAEQKYLLDAYQMLLTKMGTSFTEIRLARGAVLEAQTQITERIGITVGALTSLFLDPGASPAQLTEAALEGLFGLSDTTQPPIRQKPVSAMQTWRLLHLRSIWKEQDWPVDDYADKKLPIVDPDLLGPDDFRYPFGKADANDPDKAFDLWMNRRAWADGLIVTFKNVPLRWDTVVGTSSPDFQGIVDAMGFAYKGQTPRWKPDALADIRDKLAAMTDENAEATTQELYNNYCLTLDAARRLTELWEKYNAFWKDTERAQRLTHDEWDEVYSIILRAQKNEHGKFWIKEEVESAIMRVTAKELRKVWIQDDDASQVLLGQREFWKPQRKPVEGEWPPIRAEGIPLIDPEKVKRQDLPYPTAGERALKFWDDRAKALDDKRKELKTLLETSNFSDMVTGALGQVPAPATSWIDFLRGLASDLSSTNVATAETIIEDELHLSLESFQRIVTVMENYVSGGTKPLPVKADWAEVFSLLTSAWKLKTLYAGWYTAEIDATSGVEPWRCVRQSLQKWRVMAEDRQRLERAFERKSSAPFIDPDMLASVAYLNTPGVGDAWTLWDQRLKAIDGKFQLLVGQGAGATRTASTLDSITDAELGRGTLQELAEAKKAGKAIAARLQQLGLSFNTLNELLRVRELLRATPPQHVLDSEWESICSILTQVWKQRQFADWQVEERTKGLSLSPDSFRLLPLDLTQFPPPPPPKLDTWRGSPDVLMDWLDKLQSRIDQEQEMITALENAVSDVEEHTLPALRDTLVFAAYTGLSSAPAGRWLGDHLAIATEYDGCNKTTRISQAIETFQIILWSVRTGTLLDVYPNLKLNAPDFDEEWKWIGSYATWRAAMFVFLYPENIVLPTLRRVQTPAFRQLVDELRGIKKLTPSKAREVAERYASYFRDVCTLGDLAATTNALTTTNSGDRYLWYLFATGGETQQLYWSVYDPTDPTGYALSFWDVVPGLAGKTATMVGTDAYQVLGQKRYLYLFVKVESDGKEELSYNRYDLRNRTWQPELSTLELPDRMSSFSATLREKFSTSSATELPRIAIKGPNGVFYERFLDKAGLDWEDGDWIPRAQIWKNWVSADPTTLEATKLQSGGRLFAADIGSVSVHVSALGKDGQVYGFLWQGRFIEKPSDPWGELSWDLVVPIPKFTGSLLAGSGGITGVYRGFRGGTIDLFTVGNDNGIYTAKYDPSTLPMWGQWARVGDAGDKARANSIVAATARHSQIIDIFIIGTRPVFGPPYMNREQLYQASWEEGTSKWSVGTQPLVSSFVSLFPINSSAVTAVAVSPHRVELLLHYSIQEALVNITWTDTSGWPTFGFPSFWGAPLVPDSRDIPANVEVASAVRTRNLFDLFMPRKSGEIWTVRRDVNVDWGKWEAIGERSARFADTTVVSTVVQNAGDVLLFAIDNKGIIQSNWQRDDIDNGKWHTWAPVEAPSSPDLSPFSPNGYVAAVLSKGTMYRGGMVRIFTIGKDGNIYGTETLEDLPQRKIVIPVSQYQPKLPLGTSVSAMVITEQLTERQRADRPSWVASVFSENLNDYKAKTIQEYLEEMFYFVPAHIALQLQKSGAHITALDWFRLVYDYTMPFGSRQLMGLPPGPADAAADYQRKIENWLLDPLNPHAIAKTRSKAYTRFTLQSIVGCLLDYADIEFTRDTAESIPRARELYEAVLELLDAPELRQKKGECDQIIGVLSIVVNDPHYEWIEIVIKQVLEGITDVSVLKEAVAKLSPILAGTMPAHQKYAALQPILSDLSNTNAEVITFKRRIEEFSAKAPLIESAVLSKTEIATAMEVTLVARLSTRPDGSPSTLADVPSEPLPIITDITPQPGSMGIFTTISVFGFCVPSNPVLRSLRMRADLNLYKIRNCRNIAGMQRQIEPFAAPTDTSSGMPIIGGGGQLVLPGIGQIVATPYRYAVLIDRAKQLVQQAVQMESAFLAALEKSDREAYDLLNARANIRLAQAGIRLQDIRVVEARDGVNLAELQRDRSNIQAKTYEEWIDIGQTAQEQDLLAMYGQLADYQIVSEVASAVMQGISGSAQLSSLTIPWVRILATISYNVANATKGISDIGAIIMQRQINQINTLISYERRMQEWSLQKSLADQDVRVGEQQIQLANDHTRIVEQERVIEQMKADNAKDVLDFLTNKFTNKELYDWMSGILDRVYGYFLQQATSMAQLAAAQLSFERQETSPGYIQDDYWETPAEESGAASPGAKAPDRRGLTGSARLLQDIYQLDQYAFEKNQRKQQLTKIISLAQLDPFAFQRFRETGILPFTTPMELFDRDFPGHFLRLIKRVRTTMIALIPPNQGIRATLTSSGISRVVIGGDMFQTVVVRRSPDTVALSAAFNATGLFELQEQPEMLLPFEDQGVATSWEFAMPKAANPFDYSTIADVLITIEYMALNSFDYKQQVSQVLNAKRTTSADRAFSFRNQFADAWYDLNNPEQTPTPMSVGFQTFAEDFPPNVDNVKIENVAVYFARRSGNNVEFENVDLSFAGAGSIGGICRTENGLVSTRLASGSSWLSLRDNPPFGKWRLSLPEETARWFKDGDVTDILFVVTYVGRLPEWPL